MMLMKYLRDLSYPSALSISIVLHLLVLALLLMAHSAPETVNVHASSKNERPIINAFSVDKSALTEQVEKLKVQRQAQQRAQELRQQELQSLANRAAAKERAAREREQAAKQHLLAIKKKIDLAKSEVEKNNNELQKIAKNKLDMQRKIKEAQLNEQKLKQATKQKLEMQKQQFQEQARKRMQEIAAQKQRLAQQEQTRLQEQQQASELTRYKALILQSISRVWIYPANVDKSKTCRLQVHLAADGTVMDVTILDSSGDPILDRSAQSAVYKASPLPVPSDQDLFAKFRILNLTMRPEKVLASI